MTHTAANITKAGSYDSVLTVAYAGSPMVFSQNIGLDAVVYSGTGLMFSNILKGAQNIPRPGKPWSAGANRSSGATYAGNWFWDSSGGEEWKPLCFQPGLDPYIPSGDWQLRWVGTCTAEWRMVDYAICTETGSQTNSLIAGQTHADFDGVGANGSFVSSTGHAVDDVVTFDSGATATVDAIDGSGNVTQFTIDKTGDYNDDHGGGVATGDDGTQVASTADNQASSTGSGTGFNLTPGVNNILHRRVYNVSSTDASNTNGRLDMLNGTCTRVELLQPGNETRFDQGEICASQWLTDNSGIANLRFMGVSNTNNSPFRDYDEYPAYEDATWGDAPPAKAIAKACNELNAEPWVNIPHMFTDAACNSYFTDIFDTLDSGKSIWVEYGNETWNGGAAFKEANSWTTRGDVASQEATITLSTSLCTTASPHGLTTADPLTFYKVWEALQEDWPGFRTGSGTSYAVVDSATTFRVARTADMANRGNDVTSTGDADYDPVYDTNDSTFANMTYVRFKPDTQVKTQPENQAIRSVEIWDLADAIFTRARVKHIIMGQRANPSKITTYMQNADVREKLDYAGVACYYRWLDLGGAIASLENVTSIVDAQDETNYDGVTYVTNAQDETIYNNDPVANSVVGDFTPGSGYNPAETITVTGGTVITVDAVDAGAVTQFTVDSSSDTGGHTVNATLSQTSTSGTGTGFDIQLGHWNMDVNGTFAGGLTHSVSDVIRLGRTFTADTANNRLDGVTNQQIWKKFQVETTGTLPAPLQINTDYWVVAINYDNDWIQVSTEGPYGAVLEITDTGTGQHRIKGYIDVTVDAVDGSGTVTQFTIDATNDGGRNPFEQLSQISTTGSGTGFSITPSYANIASTATLDDCYTFCVETSEVEVMAQQQNNINEIGRDIFINYEGYDHQGSSSWSYPIRSIGQLVESWARSAQRTTLEARWSRALASKDVFMTCYHSDYSEYDHSGAWGRMEHQGDTDSAAHAAISPYLARDGAPKL